MGNIFTSIWDGFFGSYKYRICMVGLDNAGKTTLLYRLAMNEVVKTHPTIGANVESVKIQNVDLHIWDLGGQQALRDIWSNFLNSADHVILVVDSTDHARFPVVKYELVRLLRMECLEKAAILVFANKQDVPGAVNAAELADKIGLTNVKNRKYHIQNCSVLEGTGIQEGIQWLISCVKH